MAPDPDVAAWVYLLWCRADDTLYCGWTNDLERRIGAHQAGTASRYTRSRLPVELALALPMADASAARREEARIKRLTRAQKLALIAGAENPPIRAANPRRRSRARGQQGLIRHGDRANGGAISTIISAGSTMRSFVDIHRTFEGQPRELGAILAQADTGRGQEQLFRDQRPELLKRLSEHARIASITASNAIEGVIVDGERAEKIVEGAPRFRNRSEQEFAGYRDAVDGLMRLEAFEPLSVPFVLHLHRQMFAHAGGRGGYVKTGENVIVSYGSGEREVVFVPPPPNETEFLLTELLVRYNQLKEEGQTHPLVLIGALIVDFLAIHPVADGNGRLARLLTTYELLSQGYGVARYVSIEQRIFESKNTYYERLYQSQRDWHQGKHTIWPWTTYLAQVVADAYEDFEQRMVAAREPEGSKQDRVRRHILEQAPAVFRRREVERSLPEVSPATIRLVINALRDDGDIVSEGAGPSARWRRVEPTTP